MFSSCTALLLQNLPDDILYEIVRCVPHTEYPYLAQTCRRLHDMVISQLYRSVYYRGTMASFEKNFSQRHRLSEIHDILKFQETIRSSTVLSSHLRHCSFEWVDYFDTDDKLLSQTANLLPPTIETLHLSLLQWPPHPRLKPKVSELVTSVAVNLELLESMNNRRSEKQRESHFFNLWSLPNLNTLTTHGAFEWDLLVTPNRTHRIARVNTSTISHLRIVSSMPSKSVMSELMRWAKQLLSIEVILRSDDIPGYLSDIACMPEFVDMTDIVESLHGQSENLESISFVGKGILSHKPIDWTPFKVLRRLGFPRGNSGESYHEPEIKDYSHVFESLPAQLEELQIEQPGYQKSGAFLCSHVPCGSGMYDEGDTIRPWVCDLVERKSSDSLPALNKILVWPFSRVNLSFESWQGETDEMIYQRNVERLLGDLGETPLIAICERVGIALVIGMDMSQTIMGESIQTITL